MMCIYTLRHIRRTNGQLLIRSSQDLQKIDRPGQSLRRKLLAPNRPKHAGHAKAHEVALAVFAIHEVAAVREASKGATQR